ncbi:LOW QUALITY PROTEIN: predicted protein, partial [Enterococcus faecalis T1]
VAKYCNKLGIKLTRRRTLKALVKIAVCSLQMITHKSDVLKLKEMGCNSSLFFLQVCEC